VSAVLNNRLKPRLENQAGVKLLFVPFAIVAFVLFLLLLGAIGLLVSMTVLAFFGKLWRVVMRR
jgi:hypothetical protein